MPAGSRIAAATPARVRFIRSLLRGWELYGEDRADASDTVDPAEVPVP
jgi:hypothetical protein